MTEEASSGTLWDKTLRCGTAFFDRRLKPLFIDALLSEPLVQTRQFLFCIPSSDYRTENRQAQALNDSVRVAGRPPLMELAVGNDKEIQLRRGARTLSMQTFTAESHLTYGEAAGSKLLAFTS